jgi:hypothetical protein
MIERLAEPEPTITVSIGKIELTAPASPPVVAPPSVAQPPPAAAPARPTAALSLEDYLRSRDRA